MKVNNRILGFGGRIARQEFIMNLVIISIATIALSYAGGLIIGFIATLLGAKLVAIPLAAALGALFVFIGLVLQINNSLKRVRDSHNSKGIEWLFIIALLVPLTSLVTQIYLAVVPTRKQEDLQLFVKEAA